MKRRKKGEPKEVGWRKDMVAEEDLPLPFVLSPGHYGSFFGFRKNPTSEIFFCDCSKIAIYNWLIITDHQRDHHYKFHSKTLDKTNMIPLLDFGLGHFPDSFKGQLLEGSTSAETIDELFNFFKFQSYICHECNKSMPTYKYCVPMYGGLFKQNFGWYINKQRYEYGISGYHCIFHLKEACPPDLDALIDEEIQNQASIREALFEKDWKEAEAFGKNIQKKLRPINNYIENEVRVKFGVPRIGEKWLSETMLFNIIKELYPTFDIKRHYRPDFLEGLELDIYITELNVGIEYQGIQHFKPIDHWGGEEAFRALVERDKKKMVLCKKNKVPLIYFNYDEDLSNSMVKKRIIDSLSQ